MFLLTRKVPKGYNLEKTNPVIPSAAEGSQGTTHCIHSVRFLDSAALHSE